MINKKFIDIRQKNKLSQAEFGNILNVKQDVIGRIERGQQEIDLKLLLAINEKFDVNLHWLLTDEDVEVSGQKQIEELKKRLFESETENRVLRELAGLGIRKRQKPA